MEHEYQYPEVTEIKAPRHAVTVDDFMGSPAAEVSAEDLAAEALRQLISQQSYPPAKWLAP